MIVRPAPASHYEWIAERAHLLIGSEFRAIEAVDGERICGMVGYDAWTDNAVQMHVAVESPIAVRALLEPAFGIPFLEFNKGLVLAPVLSTNWRSVRFVTRLGFDEVARIRDGWARGVDMILYEMRRENCRWLRFSRKAA